MTPITNSHSRAGLLFCLWSLTSFSIPSILAAAEGPGTLGDPFRTAGEVPLRAVGAAPFLTGAGMLTLGDDGKGSGGSGADAGKKSFWRGMFGCDVPLDKVWAFEFGVGVISDNTPADYLEPKLNKLHGPGGGQIYNFTISRRVHQFEWQVGTVTLRPEFEVPLRLTLVDENSGRLVPDLNLGFVLRWRDFPWNRFLLTSLAAGPGFSYSFQVWTADYQRHPEDTERSRLKFWLPIEMTFAIPRYPRHQLVAFIDHQSGGTLFDRGGVDAWGLGYRFEF